MNYTNSIVGYNFQLRSTTIFLAKGDLNNFENLVAFFVKIRPKKSESFECYDVVKCVYEKITNTKIKATHALYASYLEK